MALSNAVEKMTVRMSKFFNSKKKDNPVDPVDEYCKTGKMSDIVKQYAFEVTDFSSQYGSEISISYTACNLQGQGNIYPSYGDFTQACVFRTYGPWWDNVSSSREPFQRTPSSFCSQDYIEVSFKTKVFPIKLEIYETYNPGCVVRILACARSEDTDVDTGCKLTRWKTLWEGCNTEPGLESRMFCPPLNKCPFPTDLIRLELCHTLVHYYTELDYVLLYGSTVAEQKTAGSSVDKQDHDTDKGVDHMAQISPTCKAMEELSINSKASSPQKQRTENKEEEKEEEIDNINTEIVDKQKDEENEEAESDNGYFDLLPEEVIQLILSFLDVLSLCRVVRTCRLLHQHSYDSLQYTELNLQPHWTQVNDIALDSLQSRSRFLYRLNLSWCHGNIVSNEAFCRYIQACGHNLRCLYLSSCSFLKTESIKEIVTHCPNLTEFDLDSCKKVNSSGLAYIKDLKSLERLNLYRTDVDLQTICNIIRSCPELRILNLGSCNCINAYDDMLIELGRNCKKLISLDLWRSKTVSHVGILALAEGCPKLQELDIGWCPDIKSTNSFCIIRLVEQCPGLKKLYLTANRTVCTADLEAIAKHCRDLEQLDILGTRQVSAEAALEILRKCEKLIFFDVSFCSGINKYDVDIWTKEFPKVSIKKSFQN